MLEELISNEPDNFDAQLLICRIHMAEKDLNEAVKVYQQLRGLKPDFQNDEIKKTLVKL